MQAKYSFKKNFVSFSCLGSLLELCMQNQCSEKEKDTQHRKIVKKYRKQILMMQIHEPSQDSLNLIVWN